jgi:hypothetical protein
MISEKKRIYNREYAKTHRVSKRKRDKEYYARNRDKLLKSVNDYRNTNKEEINRKRRESKTRMNTNKTCAQYLGVVVAENVLSKVFPNVTRMLNGNPGYDFVCAKGRKIDVKSSSAHYHKNGSMYWVFNICRNDIADYFMLIAFDDRKNLNPLKLWLIPGGKISHLYGTSVSENTVSKWAEYALPIDEVVKCCDNIRESN